MPGIKTIEELLKFIEKNDGWSFEDVFGTNVEDLNRETANAKEWSDLVNIFKDKFQFTDFQVGIALGSQLMMQLEKIPVVGIRKKPALGGS